MKKFTLTLVLVAVLTNLCNAQNRLGISVYNVTMPDDSLLESLQTDYSVYGNYSDYFLYNVIATGGYIGNKDSDNNADFNCIDDDGNEFCSVYEVTVTNPSKTTAQTIYARIDVGTNDFPKNAKDGGTDEVPTCSYLKKTGEEMYCEKSNVSFAVFKGTANDVNTKSINKWNVDGTITDKWYSSTGGSLENALGQSKDTTVDADTTDGNVAGTPVLGKLGDMVVARTAVPTGKDNNTFQLDTLSQTLAPQGSATYTIVMWLHENYTDQETSEGKVFAAGITFSTSLKGSGVTAVLATTNK